MPRPRKPPVPEPRRSRGAGSVSYVERRGRWRAILPRDAAGQRRQSWHATRTEAEAWIAQQASADAGAFDPGEPLGAYLNYWYELRRSRWEQQTARRYRYELAALDPALTRVPLARLRGNHLAAAQAALLNRGVSRRYAYNVLSLLARAFDDAVSWGLIARSPVDRAELPKPEHTRATAWTEDELRAVLAAIVGHPYEAAYLVILWGGLRIGEVLALRWSDIADDGTVSVTRAEQTAITGRPIGPTKSGRERETLLPSFVAARLRALREAGPPPVARRGHRPRDVAYVYLVQDASGERASHRMLRKAWVNLASEIKVSALRPHGGRRTWATAHMVAGTPLADLATMAGHANPAITAASYLGASRDRQREAVERLAERFSAQERNIGAQNGAQSDG